MANRFSIPTLPLRIVNTYHQLHKLCMKLHSTAASIGFIRKAIYNQVTPNFVKVKGQFPREELRNETERKLLFEHLNKHNQDLKELSRQYAETTDNLLKNTGYIFGRALIQNIQRSLTKKRLESFLTKNKKLHNLISRNLSTKIRYLIPVINLTDKHIAEKELRQLSLGFDHGFVDKNKHIKKNLASNLEVIAEKVTPLLNNDKREDFHEFLRAYTDILSKNVYATKDDTYHNLKRIIQDSSLAVVSGDKDSCVLIMEKDDYLNKLQQMIDDGINRGVYSHAVDNTLKDLKIFRDFLYRNFKDHPKYDKMLPKSSQPARLYGTAKTHKFDSPEEITTDKLKFRPIIAQTGTCTYNAAQVIASYLKPLTDENPNIIRNTQDFPTMLKEQPPLDIDEEYVSYDVESLFTNIPVKETIDYIINEIYVNHKIKPMCSKLIFKRLLLKLTTESTFIFNGKFYRQIDGCTMGGPLSVVFSDIFMTKMEKDALYPPRKPLFYKRFVDDIITRRMKSVPDELFQFLNQYHPNIKLTCETNPERFLDTKIINTNNRITTAVFRKETKFTPHWSSRVPKRYKRNAINGDLSRAKRISSNFDHETKIIRQKFLKAEYPSAFINSVLRDFHNKQKNTRVDEDEYIIPPDLFEIPKKTIMFEFPYCPENEIKAKRFLSKFHEFTNNMFQTTIKWITKKIKNLFSLKDKNPYPACQIYQGKCICGETYIGETVRNVATRWKEHQDVKKTSEPAKHLSENPDHNFEWKCLLNASTNSRQRKNLEASFIAVLGPSLNNQLETKKLILFNNGVT